MGEETSSSSRSSSDRSPWHHGGENQFEFQFEFQFGSAIDQALEGGASWIDNRAFGSTTIMTCWTTVSRRRGVNQFELRVGLRCGGSVSRPMNQKKLPGSCTELTAAVL